jgi:hypothetical protein
MDSATEMSSHSLKILELVGGLTLGLVLTIVTRKRPTAIRWTNLPVMSGTVLTVGAVVGAVWMWARGHPAAGIALVLVALVAAGTVAAGFTFYSGRASQNSDATDD